MRMYAILLLSIMVVLAGCTNSISSDSQKGVANSVSATNDAPEGDYSLFSKPVLVSENLIGSASFVMGSLNSPQESPDSRYLVITEKEKGTEQLTIIDMATGNKKSFPVGFVHSWSPDSSKLFYTEAEKKPVIISIKDSVLKSNSINNLESSPDYQKKKWSPSGRFLLAYGVVINTDTATASDPVGNDAIWISDNVFIAGESLYRVKLSDNKPVIDKVQETNIGYIRSVAFVQNMPYTVITAESDAIRGYLFSSDDFKLYPLISISARKEVIAAGSSGKDIVFVTRKTSSVPYCYQLNTVSLESKNVTNESHCYDSQSASTLLPGITEAIVFRTDEETGGGIVKLFKRILTQGEQVKIDTALAGQLQGMQLQPWYNTYVSQNKIFFAKIFESDRRDCKKDIFGGGSLCTFNENLIVGRVGEDKHYLIFKRKSKDWSLGENEVTNVWWASNNDLHFQFGKKLYRSSLSAS